MWPNLCHYQQLCLNSNTDKINVYDKIVIRNHKKEEMWKSKIFLYINLHLIDGLGMEFHSYLSLAAARRRANIIHRLWRISLLCGTGIVIDVKKVGHAQNI